MYRYKFIIFLISNPAMKKIYELNDPPSELEERKGYFIDFVTTKSIQAGNIRLSPSQKDTQQPHLVDEIYYVIEGSGFIEINNKNYVIKERTSIFVPAGMELDSMVIIKTS
jgi:mannose-6-phosphate isomerase-like protein (cupin superfamily)